jgi:hypothetical protein
VGVNLNGVLRAFDALVMLRDAARRFTADAPAPPRDAPAAGESAMAATSGGALRPGGALEATLTNVVVAALKEAFDRDHARLELERLQLEEQRRRAEEALRAEQRRQAIERELTHLRLLAAMALFGWVASIALFALRGTLSMPTRGLMAAGWLLLLGSLGTAITAQRHVNVETGSPAGTLPLWLLIAGLALTAVSLLF